jgi:hypothetical protein
VDESDKAWDEPARLTPVAVGLLRYAPREPRPVVMASPQKLPATLAFHTVRGTAGLLQTLGYTDDLRGVKIRYKLVQNGGATKSVSAVAPALLSEPPKLQFLAWQDEWKTNQPGAARHPDGSPVTDATELKWLRHVSPDGVDVSSLKLQPEPRFLHLWFSHPDFGGLGLNEVSLLDETGNPIKLGGQGSISGGVQGPSDLNGNLGWITKTLSPAEGTNIPSRVTVRFRYTAGPLERICKLPVTPKNKTVMSLEGGSQLNGVGQDVDGRAFVAIAVDVKNMQTRQFDVVAVARDGREIRSAGSGSSGAVGAEFRVEHFDFELPLAAVAEFLIGTRPIRTVEWKDVVLPGSLQSSLESLIETFIHDQPERFSPDPPPEITKEYQQRGQVWLYPIARRDKLPAGNLFYLVQRRVFYIEWNPTVSANSHFYGPFKGDPASVFGTALNTGKLN